jgi:hypothetical protein
MRAIQYNTESEALEQWNELEALVVNLHDKNTVKYTYIEQGTILILDPLDKYEPIVSEWIGSKETFDYQPPQIEEL